MRGGAGRGQGRRAVLTETQKVIIGSRCDELQRDSIAKAQMERKAIYEAQPRIMQLRSLQARLATIQPKLNGRKLAPLELDRITRRRDQIIAKIEPLLKDKDGNSLRIVFSKPSRGLTRSEVINVVAAEYKLTTRRVEASWKLYRAHLRLMHADV